MDIIERSAILLDVQTADTVDLFFKPMFQYGNVLEDASTSLHHYKWGVDKYKMVHLEFDGDVLQPKKGCDTWNPIGGMKGNPSTLGTCEFEVEAEQCPSEVDKCLGKIKDFETDPRVSSGRYTALEAAIATGISMAIKNDVNQVAWFGHENFKEHFDMGVYQFNGQQWSNDRQHRFIEKMQHCNGYFSELTARTGIKATDAFVDNGAVRYVDTNDGTVDGNALNPANITSFLDQMIASSSYMLSEWGSLDLTGASKPKFYLQSGLYDALIEYYTNMDCCEAKKWKITGPNGNQYFNDNFTTYKGYPVIRRSDWEYFDLKLGARDAVTNYSKIQRAIFTVDENFVMIGKGNTLEQSTGSSLIVEQSPLLRDKGKTYYYSCLNFGFGLAQPQLVTFGYNSSYKYNY